MLPVSDKYMADEFEMRKAALLKVRTPLDFTYETRVNGLAIGGTEPEGTRRRIIFEIDGELWRMGTNGLVQYEWRGGFDVLEHGNTVGELLSADYAGFVGKKVYPVIAMDAPADAPVFPRISISANVQSYNDIYTIYRYSPEYDLPADATVINMQVSKVTRGNGIAKVQCRLKRGEWGDWLDAVEYAKAEAIQFRVQFILSALDGSDYAAVNEVIANYATPAGIAELITAPIDYDADLGTCYALLNHDKLIDCNVRAFVKYEKELQTRVNAPIDGQAPYLAFGGIIDTGILQDTIHIEAGGKPIAGFYFDTDNSSLQFDSAENVTASYQCGLEAEDWREMTLDKSSDNATRFVHRLTEGGWRISAVKFRFEPIRGDVHEIIGTGNGKLQHYHIDHTPRNTNCNVPCKYDGVLKVLAPIGERIYLSYDYAGAIPRVRNFLIGWEVK